MPHNGPPDRCPNFPQSASDPAVPMHAVDAGFSCAFVPPLRAWSVSPRPPSDGVVPTAPLL